MMNARVKLLDDDDNAPPPADELASIRDSISRVLTAKFNKRFSQDTYLETLEDLFESYGRIIVVTGQSKNKIFHLNNLSEVWLPLTTDQFSDICSGILNRELDTSMWAKRQHIQHALKKSCDFVEDALGFFDAVVIAFKKEIQRIASDNDFARKCKSIIPIRNDFEALSKSEKDLFALNGRVYTVIQEGNDHLAVIQRAEHQHHQTRGMCLPTIDRLDLHGIFPGARPEELRDTPAEKIEAFKTLIGSALFLNRHQRQEIHKNVVVLITGEGSEALSGAMQFIAGSYATSPPIQTLSSASEATIGTIVQNHISRLSFFRATPMLSNALNRLLSYDESYTLPIIVSPEDVFPLTGLKHDTRVLHIRAAAMTADTPRDYNNLFQWILDGTINRPQMIAQSSLPAVQTATSEVMSHVFDKYATGKGWHSTESEEHPQKTQIVLSKLIKPLKVLAISLGYPSIKINLSLLAISISKYKVTKPKNVFWLTVYTST
jgi:hypothetical protein